MITKRVVDDETAAQSTSPCHMETSIPGTVVPAAEAGGAGMATIATTTATAHATAMRARSTRVGARNAPTPLAPMGQPYGP
jgi:hypothetical protein